jgi:hypothetical protein
LLKLRDDGTDIHTDAQVTSGVSNNCVGTRVTYNYQELLMVPNRCVRGFIGREDILGKVEDGFSVNRRPCIMVIQAIGGQEKTQVALEYCHRANVSR